MFYFEFFKSFLSFHGKNQHINVDIISQNSITKRTKFKEANFRGILLFLNVFRSINQVIISGPCFTDYNSRLKGSLITTGKSLIKTLIEVFQTILGNDQENTHDGL